MKFSLSDGELTLTYTLEAIGRDYVIKITGGDAHIGSVSYVFNGEAATQAAPGHKDDFLTAPLAEALKALPHHFVILGGFHRDSITPEQIQRVLSLHRKGMAKILAMVEK